MLSPKLLLPLWFAGLVVGKAVPRAPAPITVITPEVSAQIGGILKKYNVPGMSLAFLRKDGAPEVGAWGVRTEDGDKMTPDVRLFIHAWSYAVLTIPADPLLPCLLLQGLPIECFW